MNSKIKRYQTVSIWIGKDGKFRVRGYYRACSYPLGEHDNLQSALDAAVKISRKQDAIAVVPRFDPDEAASGP